MAAMAASLMLSGVSKSGSPTERLITSRPWLFQIPRFLRDDDGCRRLDAGKGIGKKGHDFKSPVRKWCGRATAAASFARPMECAAL
jgi:hypothetical protein